MLCLFLLLSSPPSQPNPRTASLATLSLSNTDLFPRDYITQTAHGVDGDGGAPGGDDVGEVGDGDGVVEGDLFEGGVA